MSSTKFRLGVNGYINQEIKCISSLFRFVGKESDKQEKGWEVRNVRRKSFPKHSTATEYENL